MVNIAAAVATANVSRHVDGFVTLIRRYVNFLERVVVGLAGADAHRLFDAGDENLAVADLAGPCRRGDDLHHLVGAVGADGDLDPQFRQEGHGVFGAAINLGMALLPAIALDLGRSEERRVGKECRL